MNPRFFTLFIFVIIIFTYCNQFDRNYNGASLELLNDQPFKALTDSIGRFPNVAELYYKRGVLLSQHELHELAFSDYQKAWKSDPNEATALSYVSNLLVTGKQQQAIQLLEQCVKNYSGNAEFIRRLSETYLQSGNNTKALSQYNVITATDSGNFEAWYEKGLLLAQLKDTAGAIYAFEKAYALQPLQLYGIYLANLYAETKNAKALAICNELIRKDSLEELTDALFIKGIYFANTNKNMEALELFDYCIKRDWKFTEAYIEKGIILYHHQNVDEALKTFALAAKVSQTYADAYYWMGRCFETIGNKNDAKDNYTMALALDRNFPEAREALDRIQTAD